MTAAQHVEQAELRLTLAEQAGDRAEGLAHLAESQAHALLAIAKRDADDWGLILPERGSAAEPGELLPVIPFVGARVVWLQERPGRPGMRVLCTDVLGTITALGNDTNEGHALVKFDDGLTSDDLAGQAIPLTELLVVPGA